jgi:hypothetical protein
LESIILAGENLSNIDNAIEREAVLGLYPYDNKKIETRNKKRLEVHNMLLLDPGEITWDEDRRLLACLIYLKINLADFRKRLLYLFGWEDVPGEGNTKLREFLKEDYRSQEHFAYLIYDTEDEIDEAKITKDNDNSISITAKNNMFIILRAIPEYTQVEVLVRNDRGKETPVYHFIISKEDDGDRRGMHVFLSDEFNVIMDSLRVIELMKPLLYHPKPAYNDGFLTYFSYSNIVSIYISKGL